MRRAVRQTLRESVSALQQYALRFVNWIRARYLRYACCLEASCSAAGRFLPAGSVAWSMATEPAVQFSASFDRNGHKLLRKAEQLVQRAGGHALAVFADRKHNCHMYASSASQALFGDVLAIQFFRDELVHKQHPGLLVFPVVMQSQQLPKAEVFDQDPNTRHKTWKKRWSTLEAFTNELAERQPDGAFCLYMHSGKDLQTMTKSSPPLQGIFQHPGWQHFVQERLQQAEMLNPIASTTSQAAVSTSAEQPAIISDQASASDQASMPRCRKRCRMTKALQSQR